MTEKIPVKVKDALGKEWPLYRLKQDVDAVTYKIPKGIKTEAP